MGIRVGVIGPPDDDDFAANIAACLPNVGAAAVALGAARRRPRNQKVRALTYSIASSLPQVDERLQRATIEKALSSDLDAVISVDGLLVPSAVRRLRDAGIKIVLWFPDHVSNFGNLRMIGAGYDHLYFKDELVAKRLRDVYGVPASYLPEACNPSWHRPIGTPAVDGGIAVVGNLYVTRVHLLNRLAADGQSLRLYGAGWPRTTPLGPATDLSVHPSVYRQAKSKVFRQASSVLNNLHPAELSSVNCRLFEATAAGGAVLCEDRPALHDLFDVGTEVLAFSNYDQLLAQAQRLRNDPGLTQQIGDAASHRAHSDHTYGHRLEQILTDIL